MQYQLKLSKLFCGYWQTDSKVAVERLKNKRQYSQHNIEREQSCRTDNTWPQDLLKLE